MRIVMVGARFSGLDGVSLETAKVAVALERLGHTIGWFAGEIGPGFEPFVEFSDASFGTEANRSLQRLVFQGGEAGVGERAIRRTSSSIRKALLSFVGEFDADAMIVQNAWAIPMQLPLAVAAAEVAIETGIATIGHHHDFAWERPRFQNCAVPDILGRYFPPEADNIAHVVINSIAQVELEARRGLRSRVLPNVMDFERGVRVSDGGASFRERAGLDPRDVVLLQPTRVITRKGIEHTIELASRMTGDPKVVVTHPDDRDEDYWARLVARADQDGVDLRLVDAGRTGHSLASAYAAASLVCFPSSYEGYGNGLVEAVFYRKPVLVNRYPVFVADIAPLGFEFLEIDGFISDKTVDAATEIIGDAPEAQRIGGRNHGIGSRNLSFSRASDIIESSLRILGGR